MMSLRSRWFSAMSTRNAFFCSCKGTPCTGRDASGASSKSHARLKPPDLPAVSRSGPSGIYEPQYLVRLLPHQRLAPECLDVETHQRLGVGAAQVESPLRELHREPVGEVESERAALVLRAHAGQNRLRIGLQVPVDLAADRVEPHALADECRQRPALRDHLQDDEPGNHAAV